MFLRALPVVTAGLLAASLLCGVGRLELSAQHPRVVKYQSPPRSEPSARVSTAPDHDRDSRERAAIDSIYRTYATGSYHFQKVTYPSGVGDLDVPAYVFAPLEARNGVRHPTLIWVHGDVRGGWSPGYLPFVKEAVSRGYVVIAPDYRGATGYGPEFYEAIDYGGHDVDDVISAVEYARRELPFVDADRVAIMGWSNGGLIALLAVLREAHPFRAAVAIGPVANLVFRLGYKGPAYQEFFTSQPRFGVLPHERPDTYVERSPFYQISKLEVPVMVHVATNDEDVDYAESQMLIQALQVEKPDLAEIRVYEDPPGGHAFSRMVNTHYQIIETPAMLDTWARTWSFFERHLAPLLPLPGSRPVDAAPRFDAAR